VRPRKAAGFQDVVWSDETSVQLETHHLHSYRRKGELPGPKPRGEILRRIVIMLMLWSFVFFSEVYAGTEFGLSTDVSFSDLSGVDVAITVGISWSGGGGVISNDSHTAVTPVSGGGGSYIASLTYSPIATSDGGQFTANVTFRPTAESMYILGGSVQDTEMVMVNGL